MDPIMNSVYNEMMNKALSRLSFSMYSPKSENNWPADQISASKLTMKLFDEVNLDENEILSITGFLTSFTACPNREYSIHIEVAKIMADIVSSTAALRSVTKEAEVRFSVIDPFIKTLVNLTGARIKLEESVRASNIDQSGNTTPDYSMYVGNAPFKIFFLEAKTSKSLSRASVCQTVGYYMSTDRISQVNESVFPSLITEREARIISFPYVDSEGKSCVDAAVSDPILFRPKSSVDVAVPAPIFPSGITVLITFVTSYILSFVKKIHPKIIRTSKRLLHTHETYHTFVVPDTIYLQDQLDLMIEEMKKKEEAMIEKMKKNDEEMKKNKEAMNEEAMHEEIKKNEEAMKAMNEHIKLLADKLGDLNIVQP